MTAVEEEPGPSRTAGGCVLAVAAGVPVAVVFAAAPDAGVLTVWGLVVVACGWQYRRGVSDSSATPPPVAVAPSGDVFAVDGVAIDHVERGPEGVMCTIHPVREEVNGT
ncbi:hypothetical protein AB0P12_20750 [Streptomyces subrutilus]|uniref:hypothetical protein n=1 Tax=Streptomyces subrutilus TaxID=36818 RepID=UPI003436B1D5